MGEYQDPTVIAPADGLVRGDSKPMPNRGTSSGMVGMGAPYGADTGMDATNSMGSARQEGDAMDQCYPPGDGRFSSSGHSSPKDGGPGIGAAADSDAPDDDEPINPQM